MSERGMNSNDPQPGAHRLATIAIGVIIVGAFLPWLHVSVEILGKTSGATTLSGNNIGSNIAGIHYGHLLIGAGVIAAVALASRSKDGLIGAGLLAVVLAGYAAATAAGRGLPRNVMVDGERVPFGLVNPHASLAYGIVLEALAAIALLVAAARMPRQTNAV